MFHGQSACSRLFATFLAGGLFLAQNTGRGATPEELEFFESKIRPILVAECYECHQTGGKVKGGLILDHQDAMLEGGDSGPVIKPGDPQESLLVQVMRHEIEDLEMPKNGAKLEPPVISDFEKWIAMGAPDPRQEPDANQSAAADDWPAIRDSRMAWWSFQPIKKQVPPAPAAGGSELPIDRFIDAELREQKLFATDRASRAVMIRRLSFNLRGLPPTPEEIEAFVANESDDAYRRLVDRYLASPQFGERWARHWMDWLRYAESHGSEGDPTIPNAWRYRDYLIRALNEDVPYDQMVREHLAGDLLAEPRINSDLGLNESIIGPAHLRMVFHGFAPTDPLDELVRFTDDQINVVSKAFMGLTVSCARCHNHKFDPISQADFYAWFGIMASGRPAMLSANVTPPNETAIRSEMRELKSFIRDRLIDLWSEATAEVEQRLLNPVGKVAEVMEQGERDSLFWPLALLKQDPEAFEKRWTQQRRDLIAGSTDRPVEGELEWDFSQSRVLEDWFTDGPRVSKTSSSGEFTLLNEGESVVGEILPSGVYSHLDSTKDVGVLHSRKIDLDAEYDLWVNLAGNGGSVARYAVQNYPRDGTVFPVERLNGGEWRWKKFPLDYWQGDTMHFEITTAADQGLLAQTGNVRSWFGLREVVLVPTGTEFKPAKLEHVLAPVIDRFGDEAPGSVEMLAAAYADAIRDALLSWQEDRLSDSEAMFLDAALGRGLLPNSVESFAEVGEQIARFRKLESQLATPLRVPGQLETVGYDQPLFERGNHKRPLEPVPRRFLEVFDEEPYETDISGRLELAEDILRPDNPLTTRVLVNRVWHHLFGRGLVATPDNFGRLGREPSHPELLDYLAAEFREKGWSIKTLVRQIVLSDTWQRDSEPGDDALARDPDDIYLSHYPVRRLEAEAIRDSILAVSGQLDLDAMYGPPVLGGSPRRSVYVRVKRNDLDPFLTLFDAPVPASTKGRRDDTNVPGQSLTLLNDPFVINAAKRWSQRVRSNDQVDEDAERIHHMFVAALGRLPSETELDQARTFVNEMNAQRSLVSERELDLIADKYLARAEIDDLEAAARDRVLAGRREDEGAEKTSLPEPVAAWDFATQKEDLIGGLKLKFRGNTRIIDGALVLNRGNGFAASEPLPFDLQSKTLEAWVQLTDLNQQGGGVLTVQTTDGSVFDSIVIGEQQKGRWIAGSDFFRRTKSFDGPREEEARDGFVHLAVTYTEDGTITFYRNGALYGKPYQTGKPIQFKSGGSQILLGNRHGEPSGGKLLKGSIGKVRVYDRALVAEEIEASFRGDPSFVSRNDLLAAMSPDERLSYEDWQAKLAVAEQSIEDLEASPGFKTAWADLAHALFNTKEFIYIR